MSERDTDRADRDASGTDPRDRTADPARETDERPETAAEPFERGGELPPREVDRAFELLDDLIRGETVVGQQLDRLLGLFERVVTGPAETDPDTIAEFIAVVEDVLVEPDDLSEVDIDGILAILEEAIAGTTVAEQSDIAAMFDVIEDGLRDPSGLDPEDAEQFSASIENILLDVTDPAGEFGGLFALPLFADDETTTDEPVDMLQVARIGAALTQRATGYSLEAGVRTGTRMTYAAAHAESPAELLDSVRATALDELRRAGINVGEQQAAWLAAHEDEAVEPRPLTRAELEERGRRLLSKAAEVGRDESVHPAFGSILDQLATDEARILRLLGTEGPQGALDIYDRLFIPFRTELVAENLTMLGSDAGCRMPERAPLYLQNLERLGLVQVTDRPIDDLKRYEIIEAQGHVETARDAARRPKTVYKSVRLTDFGVEFCELCFPFEVTTDRETARFRVDTEE